MEYLKDKIVMKNSDFSMKNIVKSRAEKYLDKLLEKEYTSRKK